MIGKLHTTSQGSYIITYFRSIVVLLNDKRFIGLVEMTFLKSVRETFMLLFIVVN